MPPLKKDFLYSKDFAAASPEELMGKEKMQSATKLQANNFTNTYFENQNGEFVAKPLPQVVQFSSLTAAAIIDIDGDGKEEAILGGNFYPNNIELGRYDASYGQILRIDEKGNLSAEPIGDIKLEGEIRSIQPLKVNGRSLLLIARNDDALQLIGAGSAKLLSERR